MSLLDGLVAYWPFKEGAGTSSFDATANGHAATLSTSTGMWTSGAVAGEGGIITQTGQSALVPDSPQLRPTGGMTLAAWIATGATIVGYAAPVCKLNAGNPNDYGFFFNGGLFQLAFGYGSSNSPYVNIPSMAWSFVAGTYDGAKAYITINGVKSAGVACATSYTSNSLAFGMTPAGTNQFSGTVGSTMLYSRCLNDAEIEALRNNGQGLPYPFGIRRMGRPLGNRIIVP